MKDRPTVIFITLLGGLVACLCCIINGSDLLFTLAAVFASLFVFMLIGLAANKVFLYLRSEVSAREEAEKKAEEEQRKLEEEQKAESEAEEETTDEGTDEMSDLL